MVINEKIRERFSVSKKMKNESVYIEKRIFRHVGMCDFCFFFCFVLGYIRFLYANRNILLPSNLALFEAEEAARVEKIDAKTLFNT